jgi:hypothetical protein
LKSLGYLATTALNIGSNDSFGSSGVLKDLA